MVYSRRNPYSSRRKRYTRRYKKKSGTNYARMASQAWQMGKIAMGLLNSEKKYIDINNTSQNAATGGAVFNMTPITAGTAETNRVGGSVLLKSLLLRINIHYNTIATTDQQLRIMVVRPLDDMDGATPSIGNILQVATPVQNITSPLNMDNIGKYKVYMDGVYTVQVNKPSVQLNKYFTFKNDKNNMGIATVGQHATWDAAGNTEHGQLWLIVIGSTNTNPASWDYYSRVRFIDN